MFFIFRRTFGRIGHFNVTTWREHHLNPEAKYFVVLATVFLTFTHICMLFLLSVMTASLQKVRPLQDADRLPLVTQPVASVLPLLLLKHLSAYKETPRSTNGAKTTRLVKITREQWSSFICFWIWAESVSALAACCRLTQPCKYEMQTSHLHAGSSRINRAETLNSSVSFFFCVPSNLSSWSHFLLVRKGGNAQQSRK